MKKLLVILGPTATGKTDLALTLAKKLDGELVSCDSRQVYTGLDIGTGKEPGTSVKGQVLRVKKEKGFWEINGIKIRMYDVADPKVGYTVKDYVDQAEKVVEDILTRGKLPIIVGGTGLYLKALLNGLPNLSFPVDFKLRAELEGLGKLELQQRLQALSPARWESLNKSDRQNPRRLLRSIELVSMNPYNNTIKNLKLKIKDYDLLKIGLTAPRKILQKRIFIRLLARINQGMVEEAESLYRNGLTFARMKELGLEYGMLIDLLEGKIKRKQFVEKLAIKIGQYAKRQITWFKKEKDVNWFDITSQNWGKEVEKLVEPWYYTKDDQEN